MGEPWHPPQADLWRGARPMTVFTAVEAPPLGWCTWAPLRCRSRRAAGLAGHAAWDMYHYRVNRIVARSLAEFCFVLDTLLAATIVIVTAWG